MSIIYRYIHTYLCMYVYMYVCIYICTYIYTYTHMHSFFWYSSLLITDSSKAGSCRQTSMLAEPGTRECTRGFIHHCSAEVCHQWPIYHCGNRYHRELLCLALHLYTPTASRDTSAAALCSLDITSSPKRVAACEASHSRRHGRV